MVCESKASLAKLKTIRRRTDWQYYLKHWQCKATDVETVSKLLSKKKKPNRRIEMINKNGEIMRVIL
jgi:hypothetical protein